MGLDRPVLRVAAGFVQLQGPIFCLKDVLSARFDYSAAKDLRSLLIHGSTSYYILTTSSSSTSISFYQSLLAHASVTRQSRTSGSSLFTVQRPTTTIIAIHLFWRVTHDIAYTYYKRTHRSLGSHGLKVSPYFDLLQRLFKRKNDRLIPSDQVIF